MSRPSNRYVLGVALGAICLSSCQRDQASIIAKVQSAVATIHTYDRNGRSLAQGTGFFIEPTVVVTNHHVLFGASRAVVNLADGQSVNIVGVIAEDVDGDLALARTGDSAPHYLPTNNGSQRVGDPILVVGAPLGLDRSVSDGIIAAVRTIEGVPGVLQVTAAVSPGSSGSPIVDRRGLVVGVITSQMSEGQNLNFASPASRLRDLELFSSPMPLTPWTQSSVSLLLDRADRLASIPEGHTSEGYAALRPSNREDEARAQRLYQLVIEADSSQWRAWAGLGELLMGSFSAQDHHVRSEEYRQLFLRAVRLNPQFVRGYEKIDHALGMRITSGSGTQSDIRLMLVNAALAVTHNPASADAHLLAAGVWEVAENNDRAVEMYRRAIQLDPGFAEAYYRLGFLYQRMGEPARVYFQVRRLRALGEDCLADMLEGRYDCMTTH